jgi:hypothetical protein
MWEATSDPTPGDTLRFGRILYLVVQVCPNETKLPLHTFAQVTALVAPVFD